MNNERVEISFETQGTVFMVYVIPTGNKEISLLLFTFALSYDVVFGKRRTFNAVQRRNIWQCPHVY